MLLGIACASSSLIYANVLLSISPASGTEQVGQPFTVDVSVNGLNPTNDLNSYTFDLRFDPKVLEVLAVNDGTIFNYAGSTPFYSPGTIHNTTGFVALQSGLDVTTAFNGTGGLLGSFSFEALKAAVGTEILVENVGLSSVAGSSTGTADIDPGTLPVATLVTVGTAIPEPGTGALVALILACGALIRRERRS
jgi:hypothetical protein